MYIRYEFESRSAESDPISSPKDKIPKGLVPGKSDQVTASSGRKN
jgi:hypothetical protein